MSIQLNIDAPWINLNPVAVSTPRSTSNISAGYYDAVTTSISTHNITEIENRLHRLEKILVDILKDYPELILKYPDLVKSVRD